MGGRVNVLGKEGWERRMEGERLHHVTRSPLVGGQMIDVFVFRHILLKLFDINAIIQRIGYYQQASSPENMKWSINLR